MAFEGYGQKDGRQEQLDRLFFELAQLKQRVSRLERNEEARELLR